MISSTLVRQLVQEKENSELKPVKLRLKIDLVSYPAREEGLVGGARGVMVIVAGNGHGDTSSNPGLIASHIALIPLGKV